VTWIVLALLGGVVALDAVSVAQTMLSRPLVAGVLAGFLVGEVEAGLQIGALLELFLLVAVPAGGGRMPEGGIAAVVAVAGAAAAPGPGGLALGVAGGLLWGEVASRTQLYVRSWNGTHVPRPDSGPVSPGAVARSILLGLGAEGVRGVVVTGAGVAFVALTVPRLAPAWPLDPGPTASLLLLGGLASVGVVLRGLGLEARTSLLFAVGLAAGVVAAWPL
jgi:PTS system mannose-specific IIC component